MNAVNISKFSSVDSEEACFSLSENVNILKARFKLKVYNEMMKNQIEIIYRNDEDDEEVTYDRNISPLIANSDLNVSHIFQSTELCYLSNNIYDYYNVSQGKITVPNMDDGEECGLMDVSHLIEQSLCCVVPYSNYVFTVKFKTCPKVDPRLY